MNALGFLYDTAPGRLLLKGLTKPALSRAAGRLLDAPVSRMLIGPFARKNGICLSDYVAEDYRCFNDFFCRRIRPELRPLPEDARVLFAPCDGLLSAYRIREGLVLPIKQSRYTIDELLHYDAAARRYADGICLVFRLCVQHYHRYCYLDDGQKGLNVYLPGVLHTVRPIALEHLPVFVRNCREYTLMQTEHFGLAAQIEVGAMLVGRILNLDGPGPIRRGAEKGRFLYGGSTVVLLLEKDAAEVDEGFFAATAEGRETPVTLGQPLGRSLRAQAVH